jgi:hypothetical protein
VQGSNDGASGPEVSTTWTVDLTGPQTTIAGTPANGAKINVGTTAFTFTATGTSPTFECKRDSGAFAACTSPQNLSGFADGNHTFSVRATASGVTGPAQSVAWTVDTVKPTCSVTAGPNARSYRPTASFTYSCSDNSGTANVMCKLDGAYAACGASPVSFTNTLGASHTFSVYATDPATNQSVVQTWSYTAPAAPAPLLYYPFDGDAANWGATAGYDASATGASYVAAGKFGKAMSFATTVPNSQTVMNTPKGTLSFWIYEFGTSTGLTSVISTWGNGAPSGGVSIAQESGVSQTFTCIGSTNDRYHGQPGCMNLPDTIFKGWHNIIYSQDSSSTGSGDVLVYIDDVLVLTAHDATTPKDPTWSATQTLLYMGYPTSFYVDEVRFYNQVFTPQQQCTSVIGGTWSGTACTLP